MAFPENERILFDFNGADDPNPIAGWTDHQNGVEQVSNQAMASTAAGSISSLDDEIGAGNIDVFVDIATIGGNGHECGVYAVDTATLNGYLSRLRITAGDDVVYIDEIAGGGATELSNVVQNAADGDQIGLRVDVDAGTVQSYYNDGGAGWGQIDSVVESTYALDWHVALFIAAETYRLDNVGGGTYAIAAPATGDINIVGNQPTIEITITFSSGEIDFVGNQPTIEQTITFTTGEIDFVGNQPTVEQGITFTTGQLDIVGNQPTLEQTITLDTGELDFVGNQPTIGATVEVTPTTGQLDFVGNTPSVDAGGIVVTSTPTNGVIEFVGNVPEVFTGIWTPIARELDIWTDCAAGSSTWSANASTTTTWT